MSNHLEITACPKCRANAPCAKHDAPAPLEAKVITPAMRQGFLYGGPCNGEGCTARGVVSLRVSNHFVRLCGACADKLRRDLNDLCPATGTFTTLEEPVCGRRRAP